jgi:hypothetical protein
MNAWANENPVVFWLVTVASAASVKWLLLLPVAATALLLAAGKGVIAQGLVGALVIAMIASKLWVIRILSRDAGVPLPRALGYAPVVLLLYFLPWLSLPLLWLALAVEGAWATPLFVLVPIVLVVPKIKIGRALEERWPSPFEQPWTWNEW